MALVSVLRLGDAEQDMAVEPVPDQLGHWEMFLCRRLGSGKERAWALPLDAGLSGCDTRNQVMHLGTIIRSLHLEYKVYS